MQILIKKTKLLSRSFIVFLALFLTAGLNAQTRQPQTAGSKVEQLFEWIGQYYVDTVNMNRLSEEVIRKTLQQLDPHSQYITRNEVRAMNEPLEGSFDGIGVSFNILNDTILIVSVIPDGPSEKVGIAGGDKIITVNGENVAGTGISDSDVRSKLRGPKGTEVTVGICRRGYPELLTFRIIRDKVPIFSLDAAYKVTDGIGYIKLNRFSATSKKEFDDALQKLKSEGVTGLILDLTGNGGGYMETAVMLTNEFLERRQLIVYTEGENSPRREYRASSGGNFTAGKLVLMIDEGSASASEILAGAIQDWDRGILVGRRTFGKGLVQRQLIFNDGSMLRLTVSRYHTPSGRPIQKPYNTTDDEYARGITRTRLQTGELTGQPKNANADTLKYQTLVQKRTMYGGGGITPDVFVPIDTSYYSDYYRVMLNLGILNRFILNYVDENRQNIIRRYPTFEQYDKNFTVTETMLDELQNFAEKEGLPKNTEMFAKSQQRIELILKGRIANDVWDRTALFRIVNRADPVFLKALEEIRKL